MSADDLHPPDFRPTQAQEEHLQRAINHALMMSDLMDYGHDGIAAWAQDRTFKLFPLICDRDTPGEKSHALFTVLVVLLKHLGHAELNVVEMETTLDNLPKPAPST
jgi:hypothetical protein